MLWSRDSRASHTREVGTYARSPSVLRWPLPIDAMERFPRFVLIFLYVYVGSWSIDALD